MLITGTHSHVVCFHAFKYKSIYSETPVYSVQVYDTPVTDDLWIAVITWNY